ncbi:hypothetical protein [uncultured Prevotella sp.]|uniref:hypothetical protein n=1 Tax=uncultured Prevotella sp. TaxID=159272 RepID=UPI0025E22BA7|nr:hypothetical protein [uncultured Prevotella sp.]
MEQIEKELLLESISKGDCVSLVMMDGKHYEGEILLINTDKIGLRTLDGRTVIQKTDDIDTFEQMGSQPSDDQNEQNLDESVLVEEDLGANTKITPETPTIFHPEIRLPKIVGKLNFDEDKKDKSVKYGKFPPDSCQINKLIKDKLSDGRILGGFIKDVEGGEDIYFEMKDVMDENLVHEILRHKDHQSKNFAIKLNYFIVANPSKREQRKAICVHRLPIADFIASLEVNDENDNLLFEYIKKKISKLVDDNQTEDALKIVDIIFDYFEEKDLALNLINYLKKVRYELMDDSIDKEKYISAYSDYVENCMLLTDMVNSQKCNLLKGLARYLEENQGKKEKILAYLTRAQVLNPGDFMVKQMIQRVISAQDPVFHDVRDIILSTSASFDYSELIDIDIKTYRNDSRQNGKKIAKDTLLELARDKQFDSSEESCEYYLKVLSKFYRKGLIEGNEKEYRIIKVEYAVQKAYDSLNYIVREKESEMRTYFDVGRSYMAAALSMGIDNVESLCRLLGEYIKALFVISKCDYLEGRSWNELVLEYAFGDDEKKKRLILQFLIDVGAANEIVWNQLLEMENGIADIFKLFQKGQVETTYHLINQVEGANRNVKLLAKRFLHETFDARRLSIRKVCDLISKLEMTNLDSREIEVDLLNEILKENDSVVSKSNKDEVLQKMLKIMGYLEKYDSLTTTDHINILEKCINDIKDIINYLENTDNSTYVGKVVILPIAINWRKVFESALDDKKKELLPRLLVELNPIYLTRSGAVDRCFTIQITNKGERTASRYRIKYTITDENQNNEPESKEIVSDKPLIARAGNKETHKVTLPTTMMQSPVVNLNIEVQAFCDDIAIDAVRYRFTATDSPNINNIINDETIILWNFGKPAIPDIGRQVTESNIFYGRNETVEKLVSHYLSEKRSYTYVLYGLSRTGKTSILNKLKREMLSKTIQKDGKTMQLAPLPICLDIDLDKDDSYIWRSIIETQICEEYEKLRGECKKRPDLLAYPVFNYKKDVYSSFDLKDVVEELNKIGVFPFIFIDEFSFISNMLKKGNVGGTFVHMLRQLALDEKACFIFAGTYDIKDLMNNPNSELLSTGAFTNINEMQIAEIKREDAEMLMDAMNQKLQFTKEAKELIHSLSGDIPYFIQIICYSCAEYAKNRYDWIGIPELSHVVNILVGNEERVNDCTVIPHGRFDSNMLDNNHPLERDVLRYIALYRAKEDKIIPMPLAEIQSKWNKEVPARTPEELSSTIQSLLDKGIIKANGNKGFTIKVDLFRLWYKVSCLKTNTID